MGLTTGKHVFYNASVVINSVDLSNRCRQVEAMIGIVKHPGNAMGDTQVYSLPGLLTIDDIKALFFQDYAAGKVYATLFAAWAVNTTFNIVLKTDATATSPTNPAFTIPVFVSKAPILGGTHGDYHMVNAEFAVAGVMSVATS